MATVPPPCYSAALCYSTSPTLSFRSRPRRRKGEASAGGVRPKEKKRGEGKGEGSPTGVGVLRRFVKGNPCFPPIRCVFNCCSNVGIMVCSGQISLDSRFDVVKCGFNSGHLLE